MSLLDLKLNRETGAVKLEKDLEIVHELAPPQIEWLINKIQFDFLFELRKIEKNKVTGRIMPSRNNPHGKNKELGK